MGCLSDEEIAHGLDAGQLAHVEGCDECRAVWLYAHAPASATPEPWTIGRYEVRGTLGAGGLGVVLLGWDPALRREVALKLLAAREGDRDALVREARSLAAVRHRHVVAIHDVGEYEQDVYFAMERVDGISLDAWWPGQPIAERARVLDEVAEGLAAIHAAGLVHCDLKPRNIVVTATNEAVIVDLGLAMPLAGGSPDGGTPGYRAPELERGESPTAASDEFAFWRVADQMLAPASPALRRAIARGTDLDPRKRFGSMAACRAALSRALAPRRRPYYLVAVPVAAAAALLLRPTPTSHCADTPTWSPALRDAVAAQLPADTQARVAHFVETTGAAAHEVLIGACKADSPAQLRARSCIATSWQWISQHLSQVAAGHDVAGALDEIPQGTPADHCAPGGVSANPPAIVADSFLARSLRDAILAAGAVGPPEQLAAFEPAVTAIANPDLSTAWNLERARAFERAGDIEHALAAARAAADLAARNGDDLALARARLMTYQFHDPAARDAEIESLMVRSGSPGMLAQFQDAAGQRALETGDLDRAKTLFEQSVAGSTTLELAPSATHGGAEQDLGTTYRYRQDPAGAQPHLERAAELLTARFGARSDHALRARMAVAHNAMFLGHPEKSAQLFEQLAAEVPAKSTLAADIAFARCQVAQLLKDHPLDHCKAALEVARRVYGANSPSLVAPLSATAQMVMETSVRDSIPYLEEALAIAKHGSEHPNDLPYVEGLYALALSETHRDPEALANAKAALPGLDQFGQKELATMLRQRFKL
ncbi:MAG: serine/threonine-protein kinase [Kofleriaceae bacterium]